MRRTRVRQTWLLFAAIAILCLPLIVAGSFTDLRLLPGLPVAALMVIPIGFAAGLFAHIEGGYPRLRTLLSHLARPAPRSWLLVGVLLMPSVLIVASWISQTTQSPPSIWQPRWGEVPLLFGLFLVAAALEEVAWSGMALEPLQERNGGLIAALLIGVFWAALHVVPYVQVHGIAWAAGQCIFSVFFRIVLVWLYGVSRRCLLAVVLCHASYNTTWQLLPGDGSSYDPWLTAAITGVLAMTVAVGFRSWMFPGRGT